MDERGIKVKDVAEALGMTPGGAGHYLSGRRHPKPGMLAKIARRIGISVSELIEDDPSFARDAFERRVLESARDIPDDKREAALQMLRALMAEPTADAERERERRESRPLI
jgi:transcriptional regulator with XRE-family HTH domain